MKLKILYILGSLVCANVQAALEFKVSATSTEANLGYFNGEEVVFSFLLNDYGLSEPSGGSSFPSAPEMLWRDASLSDPQLWSAVSGGGLMGTYNPDSYNYLKLSAYPHPVGHPLAGILEGDIMIGTVASGQNYDSSSLGLYKDGFAISGIELRGAFTGMGHLPLFSTLPNPVEYFSAFDGTYTANLDHFSGSVARIAGFDGEHVIFNQFIVTSIEISPTAIPEPGSIAAALGCVALFFSLSRRRRAA